MDKSTRFADNLEVGQRLAAARKAKGISQLDAARLIGTSQSNISQLESGKRTVSSAMALAYCRVCGISPAEIFGEGLAAVVLDGTGSLLMQLAAASGSDEAVQSAAAYISVCSYYMLRAVYELNPHNSSEIFSLPREEADEICRRIMAEAPGKLTEYIGGLGAEAAGRLELPVESSAELRSFIAGCEALLRGGSI